MNPDHCAQILADRRDPEDATRAYKRRAAKAVCLSHEENHITLGDGNARPSIDRSKEGIELLCPCGPEVSGGLVQMNTETSGRRDTEQLEAGH